MCGICGIIDGRLDPARERDRVRAMTEALRHRGPDDAGVHAEPCAVLGHRRLSIIDLEGGRQPLCNESETVWITFNGEIYNYRELRAELQRKGHVFRTRTDTEVIVHLYEEEGADCVRRLRGMFAFAIWDRRERSLFAARDHFGQKPFHFVAADGRFLFASEIKALLAYPEIAAEPDFDAIDFYLGLRFIPPPRTMFRSVRKLAAGHSLRWKDGRLDVRPYWRPSFAVAERAGDGAWIEELSARVDDAVRSHLVSDVPVGAFLSGGIDSSMIVASMMDRADDAVETFTVGSDVGAFDERAHAATVAAWCGTRHTARSVDLQMLGRIPAMVRCLDEPSDPIAACMFEVARLASTRVKVVLGGDGGDEIFAGFDRYAAFRWVRRYGVLPRWFRDRLVRPMVRRLPESFSYKSLSQRARWLDAAGHERGGRRYARMTTFFRFGREDKARLYGPALRARLRDADAEGVIAERFDEPDGVDALHRMLYADMHTRLPEHTLMLTDRMSMAHGLEVRAPLLDPDLADFCASMPSRLKLRRGVTKYAIRRAARDRLPREIVDRPKQGFMLPVAYWLDGHALGRARGHLVTGPLVRERWVTERGIDRLVGEHLARRSDHHVRLWMLLNLDAWYRSYLDGEPVEPEREEAVYAIAR